MGIEILLNVLSGVLALGAGGLLSSELIRDLLRKIIGKKGKPARPYSERLAKLTSSLTKASQEVDRVILELAQVAKGREDAVSKLENDLASLEKREKEIKQRIETLEKVPLPVADHFAKLIESGDKRSAKRDYLLFGAGVVLSTIIAVILKLAGWG